MHLPKLSDFFFFSFLCVVLSCYIKFPFTCSYSTPMTQYTYDKKGKPQIQDFVMEDENRVIEENKGPKLIEEEVALVIKD